MKVIGFTLSSLVLLVLTACDSGADAAKEVVVSEPAKDVISTEPVQVAARAMEGRPQMSDEERAKRRKAAADASASATFSTESLIDPNTASSEVIAAIPGMSAETAQNVINGRPYSTPTQLKAALSGLDDQALKEVFSAMFVKVNLNTGDNADYLLVPTTMPARRLAREFEEYRPYKTIDDFQREMAKYVSEKEVEFLTRFVTID